MADLVFNISKGRVAELYNRVDLADPAAAEVVVVIITASEADGTLQDDTTATELIAGATAYVTNSGYAQKVLAGGDLTAMAPDQGTDEMKLDIPDQTWTGVAAGNGWEDFVTLYDPIGTQVDANMIPMTLHDFVVTPDGSDITAQIHTDGFFKAS